MALDASIISGLRPVQDPMDAYAKVAGVQQAMNQNRLADIAVQQHQKTLTDASNLADAYRGAVNPDGTIDRTKLISGAASNGLGAQIPGMQKSLLEQDKAAREAETAQLTQHMKKFELAGQIMNGVNDQASWDRARQQTAQVFGADAAAKMPAQYDPALIQENMAKAMTVKDQVAQRIQQLTLGETQRHNLASEANTLSTNAATVAASRANNQANISKDLAVAGVNQDGTANGDVESMAQGIAGGKFAPLSGFALAKPRGQAIMSRVLEINPSYDAGDFAAKNAALKGFANGKEGTALRSFNVASDHLDTLGQMADALNNGNVQILNRVGNAWNQQTGSPAPTNFNAVKEIVGKEVVKAIVAGGGGVAEREELSKLMDAANSPAQLKGVISHFKELMDAQKQGLMDQYQRTTGRTDGATVFAPSKRAVPPTSDVSGMEAELKRRGLLK
jgi:hypothetical protein